MGLLSFVGRAALLLLLVLLRLLLPLLLSLPVLLLVLALAVFEYGLQGGWVVIARALVLQTCEEGSVVAVFAPCAEVMSAISAHATSDETHVGSEWFPSR